VLDLACNQVGLREISPDAMTFLEHCLVTSYFSSEPPTVSMTMILSFSPSANPKSFLKKPQDSDKVNGYAGPVIYVLY
jgi:hypothetical protein